jgi:hypothetical protein
VTEAKPEPIVFMLERSAGRRVVEALPGAWHQAGIS